MKIFYKSFLIFMLTGAALFSATSCGSAPPVVISDGSRFPLIDIVDAKISIADTNWKEAIPLFPQSWHSNYRRHTWQGNTPERPYYKSYCNRYKNPD